MTDGLKENVVIGRADRGEGPEDANKRKGKI